MSEQKVSARGLARPTILIGLATVLAQVVQLVFLQVLGAVIPQASRDVYFYASRVPIIMVQGTLQGALAVVFVPPLIEHLAGEDREAARQRAREFSGVFLNILLAGMGVVVVLGEIWAPALAGLLTMHDRDVRPETIAEISAVTRLLWPACALVVLGTLFASVHYAHNRFRQPALALVCLALAQLGALVVIRNRAGALGLGYAHLAGGAAYLACTAVSAFSGEHFRLVWRLRHPAVDRAMQRFLPLFGGTFLLRGPMFIEASLASSLSAGTVSNLSIAGRFIQALAQLLQRGPVTSLLPYSARHAAKRDDDAARYTFLVTSRMVLLVLAPVTVGLVVLRFGMFRCLMERGEFNIADSIMVARAAGWYAPALAALTMSGIAAYSLYARQEVRFIVSVGLVATLVSAVTAPFLTSCFEYRGLAFSFSLSMLAMNVATYAWLHHHLRGLDWRTYWSSAWRMGLASGAMGLILFVVQMATQSAFGWPGGPARDLAGWHESLTLAAWLAAFTALGTVSYVAGLVALKSPELARLWEVALEKWAQWRAPKTPLAQATPPDDGA